MIVNVRAENLFMREHAFLRKQHCHLRHTKSQFLIIGTFVVFVYLCINIVYLCWC